MAGKLSTFQLEDAELEGFSPVKVPVCFFWGNPLHVDARVSGDCGGMFGWR